MLAREVDRIKFDNRKIMLASQLSHGLPGRDIIFLTDNSTARQDRPTEKINAMNAFLGYVEAMLKPSLMREIRPYISYVLFFISG